MTSPANTSDRETGTVERLVARAENMNGAMKAGGLYLRLGDYTDEDAALDREAASELTRLKARADALAASGDKLIDTLTARLDAEEAKLATAREALEQLTAKYVEMSGERNDGFWNPEGEHVVINARAALRIITEGADHERS